MAHLKQKKIVDAGVATPTKISQEINDGTQGQSYSTAPRSPYAIGESSTLVFTETRILGKEMVNTSIADAGTVRPGTAG